MMDKNSHDAQWDADAPAGYRAAFEVTHPEDETDVQFPPPQPIGLLMLEMKGENNYPFNGPYTGEADEEIPWKSRLFERDFDIKDVVSDYSNEEEYRADMGTDFDMPRPAYANAVNFTD